MKNYKAHWSTSLVVISSLATVLCLGITLYMVGYFHGWLRWEGFLPLAIILVAALFTIRGYTITPDAVLVHRLLWTMTVKRFWRKRVRQRSRSVEEHCGKCEPVYLRKYRSWSVG